MRAAILAVGSELLGEDRTDTNSLRLTRTLRRYGVDLTRKEVVGDDVDRIAGTIRRLAGSVDLVLVSGGLGPTSDDVTREATARALDRDLHHDEEVLRDIAARFASFGMRMPEVNRRQAEVVDGAVVLRNPLGSAPGLRIDLGARAIFLFPGVPVELEAMVERELVPFLEERTDGGLLETRVVRAACLSESAVEETIAPLYDEFGRSNISVLASPADIQIHLSAVGVEDERSERLERMTDAVAGLLGRAVYSREAGRTLEVVVGEALTRAGLTVATAESCTGGLVAERLTRVPGSSVYFAGGVVTYSNDLKESLLGVSAATLERVGAVSEEVALEMARGVVERLATDCGIAVTGIAGPGGGTEEKPVGTVHVAVSVPGDGQSGRVELHRRLSLPGTRERVRRYSSQWALELARRALAARDDARGDRG